MSAKIYNNLAEIRALLADGLKQVALQAIKDHDRIKAVVAQAAYDAFDKLVAEWRVTQS